MHFKLITTQNSFIKNTLVIVFVIIALFFLFEGIAVLYASTTSNARTIFIADRLIVPNINDIFFPDLPLRGRTIDFGTYPQTEEGENIPITWYIVSCNSDGTLTLISEYVIDIRQYDDGFCYGYWSKCSLRDFLNNDFYNIAFSDSEKSIIVENSTITKTRDWYWGIETDICSDKVYIPGIEDVKFFKKKLICNPTDFAKSKIQLLNHMPFYFDIESEAAIWWIRSPDFGHSYATCVITQSGNIYNDKIYDQEADCVPWDAEYVGVRPMIKVDAEFVHIQ